MKILLALNKTLQRTQDIRKIDSGFFNVYIPLIQLGHEVLFYDTVIGSDTGFEKTVEQFKPDLIFCCLTGNHQITPFEPSIETIKSITGKGNVITFNWFCDDTWRYDNFSKNICKNFSVCSTPEYSYLEKYKKDGYSNIILGQWHCNEELFIEKRETYNLGFCGGLNESRQQFIQNIKDSLSFIQGVSYEDMINFYSHCRCVLNLSVNNNDPFKKTQMKLRVFETTCANSMLLTEDHNSLNMYYEPNKEIVTFENLDHFIELYSFYSSNESERIKIAEAGHKRFLKEHTSKIRLKNILSEIKKIC